MRSPSLIIASIALALAAGSQGLAGLALRLGAPAVTLALTSDHHQQGLALYRLGRFEDAAEALRLAGPKASYNRGNALAMAGKYPEALAAYDAVLARDPGHQDARANRTIVVKLFDSPTEEGGGSRAQGADPGERKKTDNKNNSMTLEQAFDAVRQRALQIQRPQESRALIANEQWLATLPDEPGRYLKLRIAAEYRRRLEEGTAAPPGSDPW